MKTWLLTVPGVVLVLLGALWGLQGAGVVGGSPMTGVLLWAIVGPIVAVLGIVLVVIGVRQRTRSTS